MTEGRTRNVRRQRQLAEAEREFRRCMSYVDQTKVTFDERGALFFAILRRIEERDGDPPGEYSDMTKIERSDVRR